MDPVIAAGVPIVIALTEVFKPFTPQKFYPLVALLLGVVWAILNSFPLSIAAGGADVLTGATVGLVASGLYSAGKAIVTAPPSPKVQAKASAKAPSA